MKKNKVTTPYEGCSFNISACAGVLVASVVTAGTAFGHESRFTGSPMLEEVTVTAQRRAESLQDVPISVTSLSADSLSSIGISGTVDLSQAVPSVQMIQTGPVPQFFVRGVGNSSAGTGEEGANAFYVDGVYISDMKQSALRFNNIERVEVLKGPQGTLFGRNSSGGLVHVITREPGQDVEAEIKVGAGNYSTYRSQVYLAAPLAENLSADIAFTSTDQQDGWGTNLTTGKDVAKAWDWGLRSKWVWTPTDRAKVVFAAEMDKSSDSIGSAFRVSPGAVGTGGVPAPRDPYDSHGGSPMYTDQENKGVSVTIEYDLDWAILTSITGYRDNDTVTRLDADAGPNPIANVGVNSSTTTFQQELRLASNSMADLSWQAGLFFFDAEAEVNPQSQMGLAFGGVTSGSGVFAEMTTESYAGFGEVTYQATPSTQITAGLRYTKDQVGIDGDNRPFGDAPIPYFQRKDSASYEELSYRLALRYDISDTVNAYVSYNRGFKAGTYSLANIAADPVDPQITEAYEVGLKSELFNRKLRLNMSVFRYEVSDYQVRAVEGVGRTPVLLNAAEVEMQGLEIEFEAIPMNALRLHGALTFLDSEYSDFPFVPYTYPNPALCTPLGGSPGVTVGDPTGGSLTCIGSAKGNDTPLAPRFAGNVGATYSIPVGSEGEVRLSAMYSYNDGYYFEPDNRLKQPSFGLFNASILYQVNNNWAVELWGRNLGDKVHYTYKSGGALADIATPAAPRTYGIDLSYRY